ncbi:DUF4410 domain-containing protein [Geobacter sp.]|uniref:DUF4410 domain-containing protein n=1 Tax=Geobacter sp. TaxID=46610 RepID=UPI00262A2534|nr:DUF4410 domain-containing protein [Geobacter sp.]
MKIKGLAGLLAISGVLVTGCASTNLRVAKPVTVRPRTVTLTVADHTNANKLEEEMLGLKEIIADKLEDEGIKVVSNQKDAVSLTGDFLSYDSGNRGLRWLVGFGLGKATYDSNWKVVSATGEEMGNCNIDGNLKMGFFGGSVSKMHNDMAEALVDCLKGEN